MSDGLTYHRLLSEPKNRKTFFLLFLIVVSDLLILPAEVFSRLFSRKNLYACSLYRMYLYLDMYTHRTT